MTEKQEYQELLLHVISTLQAEVKSLREQIACLPSSDRVKAIEARIEKLESGIDKLNDKLEEETRMSLAQRVKIGVYIAIVLGALGVAGAMTIDLWKQTLFGASPVEEVDE